MQGDALLSFDKTRSAYYCRGCPGWSLAFDEPGIATRLRRHVTSAFHKKALERGIKLKLVTASGEALPFPDGLFDLVLSVTAFEFFENPVLAVQEMTRVCRPGGRIVVSVLNKWSIWAARRRLLSWFRDSIFTYCRFYSYREMLHLFGPAAWTTSVFAPPGIPDRLIPCFSRLEPLLRKWAKPFGAYLVICKRQKP